MDNHKYQEAALKTMSCDYEKIAERLTGIRDIIADSEIADLLHAGIGIATESGEFLDPIKKHIFYGKSIDYNNLREELGDLLWYIAIACNALNVNIADMMAWNIDKLSKRYPKGEFTDGDALSRADKDNS